MNSANDLGLLIEAREAAKTGRAEQIRTAAGLSQAEVASALGVSAACISRWESGDRRPRGPAAIAYGRLLQDLDRRTAVAA